MRRIAIWLASTVSIVVLLFGYHTSTNQASQATGTTGSTGAGSPPDHKSGGSSVPGASASGSAGSSGGSSTGSSTKKSSSTAATKSYTGEAASTEWGPVQVEVRVRSGKITKVDVLEYPNGNPRDGEINSYALPILVQETVKAQSAKIDMVSGATVTSNGYLQSLQSALDEAGI